MSLLCLRTLRQYLVLLTGCVLNSFVPAALAEGNEPQSQVLFYMEDCRSPVNASIREQLILQSYEHSVKLKEGCGQGKAQDVWGLFGESTELTMPMLMLVWDHAEDETVAHHAERARLPLLFVADDPGTDVFTKYSTTWYVGSDLLLPGKIQAQLLHEYQQIHPNWDRNGNGKVDYVLFKGIQGNLETISRAKTFRQELRRLKIPTQILGEYFGPWSGALVKEQFETLLQHTAIEDLDAVICASDRIALAAVRELQQRGFNLGPDRPYIPVLSIDGIAEGLAAVRAGELEATVTRDARTIALVAMSIVRQYLKNPDLKPAQVQLPYKFNSLRKVLVPFLVARVEQGELTLTPYETDK